MTGFGTGQSGQHGFDVEHGDAAVLHAGDAGRLAQSGRGQGGAEPVRVVVGGYLALFPLAGAVAPACLDRAGIPAENVGHWRTWYRSLDRLIREVAADRRVMYVQPPMDRTACDPDPYVRLGGIKLKAQEPEANGLHPTVAGQRALGNLIEDRLRGTAPPA